MVGITYEQFKQSMLAALWRRSNDHYWLHSEKLNLVLWGNHRQEDHRGLVYNHIIYTNFPCFLLMESSVKIVF